MPMQTELKSGVTICRLEGDLNIHAAPGIKKEFTELIGQNPVRLIIDFSKVNYVDSSGLGVLVEILKRVKTYGGGLKLINLSPMIKDMFQIVKFDRIFDILADEDSAMAAFK